MQLDLTEVLMSDQLEIKLGEEMGYNDKGEFVDAI